MSTTYCPSGHRITYSLTKPATCPACGIDMTPKVAPASCRPDDDEDDELVAALTKRGKHSKRGAKPVKKSSWMEDDWDGAPVHSKPHMDEDNEEMEDDDQDDEGENEESEHEEEGSVSTPARHRAKAAANDFGIIITRDPNEGRPMTIAELQKSGTPVERTERTQRSAPPGQKVITAAELVAEGLKNVRGNS